MLFLERAPPVSAAEIEHFWKSLLGVAEAVDKLHNLRINTAAGPKEYDGWHADIKPDKIVIVGD